MSRSGRAAGSRVVRWGRQWVDTWGPVGDPGDKRPDLASGEGARQWLMKGVDVAKLVSWTWYRQGNVNL